MFTKASLKAAGAATAFAFVVVAVPATATTVPFLGTINYSDRDNGDGFATFIGMYSGNDCPNVPPPGDGPIESGDGFDCNIVIGDDIRSPVIAKVDEPEGTELNTTAFPNLTDDMISVDWVYDDNDSTVAELLYDTTGYGDGLFGIDVTHVSVKYGNSYDLWAINEPFFLGSFNVDYTAAQNAISHVTLWDSPAPIPLPAAGWLLLTALGGFGVAGLRRRRKAA